MSNVTPNYPNAKPNVYVNNLSYVKPATSDIMIDTADIPIELMTNLIFEEIGGQELINISRTDNLNGQSVLYNPISNIDSVAIKFNSMTMLPSGETSKDIFGKYLILLDSKIPNPSDANAVEIDPESGELVINLTNLMDDEQIEVQMLSSVELYNDTIY
jgi:hypothetical protein